MTKYEQILVHLSNDVELFKEACNASICSDDIVVTLTNACCRGRNLIRNIETLVKHADDLRARIQKRGD